jgi:hypothetical protein
VVLHEPIRSSIFRRFEELLGTEEAAALMEEFPPYSVRDIVTVEILDLRLNETEARLRTEIVDMGAAIRGEMADMGAAIRGEMAEMGAAIRGEMAEMGAAIRGEMAEMGAAIRGEMAHADDSLRSGLAAHEVRLDKIDQELVRLNGRFDTVDARLEALPDVVIKALVWWFVPIAVTALIALGAIQRWVAP